MAKMPIFHVFADLANFDDKKILLTVLWSSKYSRITWYGYIRSHWDQKNDFQNFGSTPPLTAHCVTPNHSDETVYDRGRSRR